MEQLQTIREKLKPFTENQLPNLQRAITELNIISTDLDLDIFLENNINTTLETVQILQYQLLEINLKLLKLSNPIQP